MRPAGQMQEEGCRRMSPSGQMQEEECRRMRPAEQMQEEGCRRMRRGERGTRVRPTGREVRRRCSYSDSTQSC